MGATLVRSIVWITTLILILSTPAPAQQIAGRDQERQITPAAITRTVEGQPDIQGVWMSTTAEGGYSIEVGDYPLQRQTRDGIGRREYQPFPSLVVNPTDGKVPYHPGAKALRDKRESVHLNPPSTALMDTSLRCFLYGMPGRMYRAPAYITQFKDAILMQWERDHDSRVIYLDGRPHIPASVKLWNGDSRGRWEGNTLVVDVTNLNGLPWLDAIGDFVSAGAHLEERFTLLNHDTIDYRLVVTDPSVTTQPWTIGFQLRRGAGPGEEIWERACVEGNKAVEHVLSKPPAGNE